MDISRREKMRKLLVKRVGAHLPGYAAVAAVADVLHLAPRSVRDLIYSGRLPSVRVGRLHYVRATDLDIERRRRLGLRLPAPRARVPRARVVQPAAPRRQPAVDSAGRRERAAQRAAMVSRWMQRHAFAQPRVPLAPAIADAAFACATCDRQVAAGARHLQATENGERLCLTCGRRALFDWADRRRLEAAAARRLAQELGSPLVSTRGTRERRAAALRLDIESGPSRSAAPAGADGLS